MARGNKILITSEPRGRFEEIVVAGTPKPGTCMYPKNTANVQGHRTMEPAGTTAALGMGADGDMIPVAVLLSSLDHAAAPPGKIATDAYADGDLGVVYYPVEGDELNVLFLNAAGTADDVTLGMKMIIDDGTGQILPTAGTVESEPFVAREAFTDPTADKLLWMVFTGE